MALKSVVSFKSLFSTDGKSISFYFTENWINTYNLISEVY